MELEALANEIEDVTDPSSFDKVLIYFEELQKDAEEFIELLVKKLEWRQISWEQPWYQGPSPLTKAYPRFLERNEIDTEKFRTHKFTKEEHDRINKNWLRFTKKYNVPDKLTLFAGWKNYKKDKPEERARRFVVSYLARGLERTLHQVYKYVQAYNLKDYDTRTYNEYEEKIMNVCFMHKLSKAPPILTVVLGRHVRGLYKRRVTAKIGKTDNGRVRWTLERAEKLLKGMLKYSELPLAELKYKTFDKTFWLKLQEEMDRDYAILHFFWYCYLHVQIFVQSDIKLYKLRRKLFKILRDSSYKVWSDIRWAELVDHFPDGVTYRFLYKMSCAIVRKHKQYSKTPLPVLANFGLETIKCSRYTNKRLRRLTMNNKGHLEIIKYVPAEKKS